MVEQLTIINKAHIDTSFVISAIEKAYDFLKFPQEKIKVFVFDSPRDCKFLVEDMRGQDKKDFLKFCQEEKTSMSLTCKRHEDVIIYISPEEQYLKKNKRALIGTILHEFMHTIQREKGLDDDIENDLAYELKRFKPKIQQLKYKRDDLYYLFDEVGSAASFTLKDIYDNGALIQKGLGNYILEDYSNLYNKCLKPVFYHDIKQVAKQNITDARDGLVYELNMLSALIPFARMKARRAQALVKHIWKCYEYHHWLVDEAISPVIEHGVKKLANTQLFRRKYFRLVFQAVFNLLSG